MSVLVLGDGLLGSELVRQTGWDYISRRKDGFDITEPWTFKKFFEEASGSIKYSVVVNCIANTDTYSEDISSIRETNFSGPFNLVPYLDKRNIKLVQISSDYVYTNSEPFAKENSIIDTKGTNVYTFYKQALDKYLNEYYPNTLICRCSFKPLPFPYEKLGRI